MRRRAVTCTRRAGVLRVPEGRDLGGASASRTCRGLGGVKSQLERQGPLAGLIIMCRKSTGMEKTLVAKAKAGKKAKVPKLRGADELLPKAVRRKLQAMPSIYRRRYREAMRGRSRKAAMESFCMECFGWEGRQVAHCTDVSCPLYPYRPGRLTGPEAVTPKETAKRPKAARARTERDGKAQRHVKGTKPRRRKESDAHGS